ncbi:hypothetical protein AXG93_4497s1010 [Marchantia polymorpha subsp. ruderalis]|uniref:Uncharacterized protein n=1 Tax=Marchantia polymorpha subsp. ruderalis TaxID=1480154 RepID=A0A176VS19_MARPO|nr:hypothetical protein AXG93_4497s1010 [Marchantia polymorpha subsp. ruderalis]
MRHILYSVTTSWRHLPAYISLFTMIRMNWSLLCTFFAIDGSHQSPWHQWSSKEKANSILDMIPTHYKWKQGVMQQEGWEAPIKSYRDGPKEKERMQRYTDLL